VAIAIPVFNGALTKAKESADVANVRAMYAEWQIAIISGDADASDVKDNDSFLKGPSKATTAMVLNDSTKLNVTDKGVITYTATKLTNEATNSKVFSWTLGESDSTGTSADSTT